MINPEDSGEWLFARGWEHNGKDWRQGPSGAWMPLAAALWCAGEIDRAQKRGREAERADARAWHLSEARAAADRIGQHNDIRQNPLSPAISRHTGGHLAHLHAANALERGAHVGAADNGKEPKCQS